MTCYSKSLFCCLASLTIALCAGCVQLEKPYPEKSTFVLSVERENQPARASENTVLLIRNFKNSARLKTRSFVYRVGDLEYRSDFYNEFFASPADLITEETAQWLEEAGLFGHITEGGEPPPTHLLQGRIKALYGDFRTVQSPAAVLELQLGLIDDSRATAVMVLDETYRREIPLDERSPEALLKGWNTALEEILAEFEEDARKILATGGRSGSDPPDSRPHAIAVPPETSTSPTLSPTSSRKSKKPLYRQTQPAVFWRMFHRPPALRPVLPGIASISGIGISLGL